MRAKVQAENLAHDIVAFSPSAVIEVANAVINEQGTDECLESDKPGPAPFQPDRIKQLVAVSNECVQCFRMRNLGLSALFRNSIFHLQFHTSTQSKDIY